MDRRKDTAVEAILEQLIEQGPGDLAGVFARAFELAMQIERERFLGAGHYERTPERRGYANGTKPKRIDTPAGTVNVQVPKTAGHERGAVLPAIAGAGAAFSPSGHAGCRRDVHQGRVHPGGRGRDARIRDREPVFVAGQPAPPSCWMRSCRLGATDRSARSSISSSTPGMKRCATAGIVRDVAVLSAIGIGPDERRRVLGVSVALSEAEVHWRAFLESLVARGMRGVDFIVSDDHSGLRAARRAVLGGATWQRCQFHLARNAIPPRAQRRDPKAHRQTAEIDLESGRSQQGRNSPG